MKTALPSLAFDSRRPPDLPIKVDWQYWRRIMSAQGVAKISPQEAIIYLMVMTSASDGAITDTELRTIGRVVRSFTLFSDSDEANLVETSEACGALMASDDGMHLVLESAAAALPMHLTETAYAAVIDVVTADERLDLTEIRLLELIRNALTVSDAGASAIERAARARHMTLDPIV
ncbi:MAG: Tellurite resistance protein TerB [Parvularculaceae bacterium]|nr:MAG: Tellurite resistance protein TerB [Parvularculaceae bacterium]